MVTYLFDKENPIWSFKKFSMDFEWRERWDSNVHELREELMLLKNHVDPLTGIIFDEKSTHFSSRNAWYQWKRYPNWVSTGVFNSWSMQLFPTAENEDPPFAQEHMRFKVWK